MIDTKSDKHKLMPQAHTMAVWGLAVVLSASLVPAPAFAYESTDPTAPSNAMAEVTADAAAQAAQSSVVTASKPASAPTSAQNAIESPARRRSARSIPTYDIAGAALLVNGAQKPAAAVGDTFSVRAWEEDEDTYDEYDIPAHNLSYNWQVSADKNVWEAVAGATGTAQILVVSSDFAGKYLRCVVTSGSSTATTNVSSKVTGGSGTDSGSSQSGSGDTGSGNTGSGDTGSGSNPTEEPKNLTQLSSTTVSTSGIAAEAGVTLTAQAKVKGSWYEKDAPADATITYVWQSAPSADGPWTPAAQQSEGAQNQAFIVPESLVGSYVRVVVTSQNEVVSKAARVLPAQTYELDRVSVSGMSGAASTPVVGDTLSATAFAKTLFGTSTASLKGRDGVSYRWFASDVPNPTQDELTPVQAAASSESSASTGGAGSASLTLTSDLVGKYLQVEAISGSSTVRYQLSSAVLDPNSLEGIAQRLDASGFKLAPVWGQDTNANSYLTQWLQTKLGVTDVSVQVVSAQVGSSSTPAEGIQGGVSCELATNGAIDYFWADPQTASSTSWSLRRKLNVTYRLTRNVQPAADADADVADSADKSEGTESILYTPARQGMLPWDHTQVATWLATQTKTVELPLADGDSADALTQPFEAPYQVKLSTGSSSWSPKLILPLSWESSNPAALSVKQPNSWSDFTLTPHAGAQDQPLMLTATLSAARIDNSDATLAQLTAAKPFSVKVPADPALIAQQKAELQKTLDEEFNYDALVSADTKLPLAADALTQDIQLLSPRALGLDVRNTNVSYLSDSPALEISGYRVRTYQGVPGAAPQTAHLTLVLTSKQNPEVTASKTLTYTVPALTKEELIAEKNLLKAAQNNFWRALSERSSQTESAAAVTQSLSPFYKLYADASAPDGLAVAYTYAAANQGAAAGAGIVPTDLSSYDPMGAATQARQFASSAPDVIANETLRLTRPTYDTTVSVTAELSSERYARYAERYPDNPDFFGLASQPAKATFTVAGTQGPNPDDKNNQNPGDNNSDPQTLTVYAQVFGPAQTQGGASGGTSSGTAASAWTERKSFDVPADTTAAALSEQLFSAAGLSISAQGSGANWYLESVVDPQTGERLGWNEQTGQYWQLFINGKPSEVMAGGYTLKAGDTVCWYYSRFGDKLPQDSGDNSGGSQEGGQTENGSNPSNGHEPGNNGSGELAPIEGTGQFHGQAGATEAPVPKDKVGARWKTQVGGNGKPVSEPVVVGSHVLVVSGRTLKLVESATGAVGASFELDGPISYTSRPAVAGGVAYVALDSGAVEAVDLSRMSKLWTSQASSSQDQASCTVSVVELQSKPAVLVETAAFNSSFVATSGSFIALDAATGAQLFNTRNASSGYYWTGAALVNNRLLLGDQAGILHAFNTSGTELATLNLGAAISGDVVSYGTNQALVVTRNGVLHKVSVQADGKMTSTSLKVLGGSTAAIAVSGSLGVVTGEGATPGSSAFALVDLDSFTLTRVISATDQGKLPQAAPGTYGGGSKAPALIGHVDGQTYVYVTLNVAQNPTSDYTSYASGGNVYVYRVGDATARLLYAPAAGVDANYCDSPVVADAQGNLYYLNDSGYLVQLASGHTNPEVPSGNKDDENDKSNKGGTGRNNTDSNSESKGSQGPGSAQHNSSGQGSAAEKNGASASTSEKFGTNATIAFGAGQQDDSDAEAAQTNSKKESDDADATDAQKDGEAAGGKSLSGEGDARITDGSSTKAQAGQATDAAHKLPWWPFAGMGLGVAGLVYAFFGKRKQQAANAPTDGLEG